MDGGHGRIFSLDPPLLQRTPENLLLCQSRPVSGAHLIKVALYKYLITIIYACWGSAWFRDLKGTIWCHSCSTFNINDASTVCRVHLYRAEVLGLRVQVRVATLFFCSLGQADSNGRRRRGRKHDSLASCCLLIVLKKHYTTKWLYKRY